ncbi:MAG: hypothetical protein M1835_003690 [Candelina submexicana]|nr:MAG: hypothetical protein M1835_003690 [Candelina submexicana]
MAEETPQPASIQSRIAALNLGQVGRTPGSPPTVQAQSVSEPRAPAPPAPINRPFPETRRKTANNPPTQSHGSAVNRPIGNKPIEVLPAPSTERRSSSTSQTQKPGPPPKLPPRRPSAQPPPSLPPRRPSEHQMKRRDSNESMSSITSDVSSISAFSTTTARTSTSRAPSIEGTPGRVRAPVYDPSSLPPLPQKRSKTEDMPTRTPLKPGYSSPAVERANAALAPPPMPRRPSKTPGPASDALESIKKLPPELPPPMARKSPLSFGLNKTTETPPPLPGNRPNAFGSKLGCDSDDSVPPPVPLSSRPNLAQIQASKPRPPLSYSAESCLNCRDFSAPDSHAARFPRQSIPSTTVDWLGQQLTSPFPSATDKARAIFTWLHHNVAYNTKAFFSGNIQPSTPASTINSGLAVCEGYAGLFAALAMRAGLEAIVVSGHGKGYGHKALAPGEPIPPYSAGHAWNAVRIDNGEWKLIDACWGAGSVSPEGYTKHFKPERFTQDNETFGLDHFPGDNAHFFRSDSRVLSWEDYINPVEGEGPLIYDAGEQGLSKISFRPVQKQIQVSGNGLPPMMRFQFEKVCPHFDFVKNGSGKPYVFVLGVHGNPRANEKGRVDYVPFETNNASWWLDIDPKELGAGGEEVSVFFVRTIGDDDGRGWSVQQYKDAKGRKGMGFGAVAKWDLR